MIEWLAQMVHERTYESKAKGALQMNTISKWILAVAISGASASAGAQNVTYDYTGQTFTSVAGSYTTADSLQGTFTIAGGLGDNLNDQSVTPIAFSVTDGVQTLSSLNGAATDVLSFSTNAAGSITAWAFYFTHGNAYVLSCNHGDGCSAVYDQATPENTPACRYGACNYGENDTAPGTWSVAAVPLPASAWLLLSGLVGVGAMARKRRAA